MKHVLWRLGIPFPGRGLAFLSVFVVFSSQAEVVSVDVYEWARIGTGVTPSGWTVTNVDEYASEKGVRFDTKDDIALSPVFPGVVTQLVMNVKSSNTNMTRFLTAVPVVANAGARSLPANATKSYEIQALVWRFEEEVRRFRLQNVTGREGGSWGVRSLDVYINRIEAPQDLREEAVYSDAFSAAWTPDARAVSSEVEAGRITVILPKYDLLRDFDFTSLTNTSGNPKPFLELRPPDELRDVEGLTIGLQGNDGGHLQIGNTKTGGVMRLLLPTGSGREAVMDLLRSDKDNNFSAVIAVEENDGQTNECARIPLVPEPMTSVVSLADEAKALLLISERGANRIRVEDVKIVTDYVPGYEMTNEVARCRTARNARTFKGLEPGDFIWRVRSFDEGGTESAWSPYRKVTLSADDPRRPVPGLAVVIR